MAAPMEIESLAQLSLPLPRGGAVGFAHCYSVFQRCTAAANLSCKPQQAGRVQHGQVALSLWLGIKRP